jgi:hypothetical protein
VLCRAVQRHAELCSAILSFILPRSGVPLNNSELRSKLIIF